MLTWQLVRGKPIWDSRDLRDNRRHCLRKIEKVVKQKSHTRLCGFLSSNKNNQEALLSPLSEAKASSTEG